MRGSQIKQIIHTGSIGNQVNFLGLYDGLLISTILIDVRCFNNCQLIQLFENKPNLYNFFDNSQVVILMAIVDDETNRPPLHLTTIGFPRQ